MPTCLPSWSPERSVFCNMLCLTRDALHMRVQQPCNEKHTSIALESSEQCEQLKASVGVREMRARLPSRSPAQRQAAGAPGPGSQAPHTCAVTATPAAPAWQTDARMPQLTYVRKQSQLRAQPLPAL